MKTSNHQSNTYNALNESSVIELTTGEGQPALNHNAKSSNSALFQIEDILTTSALYHMALGQIPDLYQVCYELYHSFFKKGATNNALQFVSVLKNMVSLSDPEIEYLTQNSETSHILIQNELLKVVLIYWPKGKLSSIHAHPKGGCVFKVLHGKLEEKRYTPDTTQQLLSVSTYQKGAMGYIDDQMAYHAVGNPFDEPAISLHAYTPGL